MLDNIKSRISSDSADSNTISMILWISLAVVLVLAVGSIIYNAVSNKATEIGNDIQNAEADWQGGGGGGGS